VAGPGRAGRPGIGIGLGVGQTIRQAQTQTLTAQQRQSLQLLQMTNLELQAALETAAVENPLLIVDDGLSRERETTAESTAELGPVTLDGLPPSDPTASSDDAADNLWNGNVEATGDLSARDGFSSPAPAYGARPAAGDRNGPDIDYLQNLPETPSLRDHLLEQVAATFDSVAERAAAMFLIGRLDADGYLRQAPADLALELGVEPRWLGPILDRLREFDPPGVFARDLADCLALQLRDAGKITPALQCVLGNLELLAAGALGQLQKKCGCDEETLRHLVGELRQLQPNPAAPFGDDVAAPVVPDLIVTRNDGELRVELNDQTLPRLIVDRDYASTIRKSGLSSEDSAYVRERLQAASWLVRAMHQRARTLLRVGQAVLARQSGFFMRGIGELKPLTLREVADELGLHESTVSRAVAGKFLQSPFGTLPLRFFFASGVAGSDGDAHAAAAIQSRIKDLVRAEGPKPLSDDKLVRQLRAEGYDIARRTVAKYREGAGIPSSVERRKKRLLAG